ncbi:MAG: M48 family metalloprotease [Oscillospiraceae bacterium]|jgi:heat shock protein HtpX|nr:M48 family metalloprotease [Oscillospiraceae bacterium]
MAKFCPDCGASLPDIAKFCASCGAPVPIAPAQPSQMPQAKSRPNNPARTSGNGAYVAWYLFYLFFFIAFFPIYIITTMIAFSNVAEKLWRRVSGIRPLRLKSEKERLLPLFAEVYAAALEKSENLPETINLYIKEDMSINAFAFGKSTLVLTRGSVELLNDDCLKGLIAHELGHFAHHDTEAVLLMTVSNFFMSFFFGKLTDFINRHENGGFLITLVKVLFYYPLKVINFIGELILMHKSRQNEYRADGFALKSGFGKELNGALIKLYSIAIEKPQSVKEQFKATHPHITLRIEQLEKVIY